MPDAGSPARHGRLALADGLQNRPHRQRRPVHAAADADERETAPTPAVCRDGGRRRRPPYARCWRTRFRICAAWARVAGPCGSKVPPGNPLM